MNKITFTVEETNLLSIYAGESKQELIESITAVLPYMNEEMRTLAERSLAKLDELTETEYAVLDLSPAEDEWAD